MPDLPVAAPSRFHFSTSDIAGRDRLAIWREVFGRQVARLDISPVRGALDYRSEIIALPLPGLSISWCEYDGVRSARTHELTSDNADDVIFGFVEHGAVLVQQLGRDLTIGAGRATTLCTALPNVAVAAGELRLFNLVTPRATLATRVPRLEERLARDVADGNIAMTLLRQYTRAIFDSRDALLTPQFIQTAVNHMQDLLVLALGATGQSAAEASGRGLRAARLSALKAEIARRLGDPALSAEAVGAAQGISASYARRLFEYEGQAFSDYLLAERLEAARRRLADPAQRQRTILSIAMEMGFSDASWFNRAFRRRFGATPSDIRAKAARGLQPPR